MVDNVTPIAPSSEPTLSRDVPVEPDRTAMLIIDVQNYCCHVDGAEFEDVDDVTMRETYGYYFDRLEPVVYPNTKRLQDAVREAGGEVVFMVIQSLTLDGRDRGLDYKISSFNVPVGSWDAKVIDEIAPVGDEIVIPKTASSVFNSTNIEYLLRNLGVDYLIICGTVTDQCVDTAVRDACDNGFLVTLAGDLLRNLHARTPRCVDGAQQGLLPPGDGRRFDRGACIGASRGGLIDRSRFRIGRGQP